MKNFKKFIPAVLAAAALASCSGDDLMVIENAPQVDTKAGLAENVTVKAPVFDESFVTRAGYDANFSELYFQENDELQVYVEDLSKFDRYYFNGSRFARPYSDAKVATPAFALFPGDMVDYHGWDVDDEGNEHLYATMEIQDIDLSSTDQWKVDGELVYAAYLPLWGTARKDDQTEIHADMDYLTANLVIILGNTKNVIDKIVVKTTDDNKFLTGVFHADLNSEEPVLELAKKSVGKTWDQTLKIDVKNVESLSSRYIVTVPVIAGTYKNLDVYAVPSASSDPEDETTWIPVKHWGCVDGCTHASNDSKHKPKAITKGKFYLAEYNADVKVTTPEGLNRLIAAKAELGGTVVGKNVEITLSEPLEVKEVLGDDQDYTIIVPNMNCDELIINIPKGVQNTISGKNLVVRDSDPNNVYTKNVVLKLGDGTNTTKALSAEGIEVNLKKANVTLAGWYDTSIKVTEVNSITFGDGINETVVASNSTVDWGKVKEAITIAEHARYNKDLDLVSTNLAKAKNSQFTVTVNGMLNGVSAAKPTTGKTLTAGYAKTVIGGGACADEQGRTQVETLVTFGDVVVNQTGSREMWAVGTLELKGNENNNTQNIDLKYGYIKEITSGATKFNSKNTTVNVSNIENGPTGIGKVTSTTNLTMTYGDSEWAGGTLKTSDRTVETGIIYTASQLAGRCLSTQVASTYKLNTTMDLKDNPWTGTSLAKNFDGNNMIVKNVNLKADGTSAATVDNTAIGLFSEIDGSNVKIEKLSIDGLTFTQKANESGKTYPYANIGALAGKVKQPAELYRVIVKGAKFEGKNKNLQYVGGLVGSFTGYMNKLTVNRCEVEVEGLTGAYHSLGGLIGGVTNAKNTIDLSSNIVNVKDITVTKTLASGSSSDENYGKVGLLIGYATSETKVTSEYDKANSELLDDTKKADLHFGDHKLYYLKSGEVKELKFYGDNANNNFIGYSASDVTLTIDDEEYTNFYNGKDGQLDKEPNTSIADDSKAFNVFK